MQKLLAFLIFILACHTANGQRKYNTDIYILDAAKIKDVSKLVSNKEMASSLAEKQFDFKWKKPHTQDDKAAVIDRLYTSLQANGTDCPPNIVHVAGNIYKCGNGKLIYIDSTKLVGFIPGDIEPLRENAASELE